MSDIQDQLNQNTTKINSIINQTKKITELSLKDPIDGTEEIPIAGEKKITTQQIIDLFDTSTKIGFLDYADLATQTTPISVTGGAGAVAIPNDGIGTYTNTLYPPSGVTSIWDSVSGTFDWSELSIGDMIDIRLHLQITTLSVNTAVTVALHLGSGGSAYSIPFITSSNIKTVGVYDVIRYNGIYIGNTDTLNNGGVFKISSDNNITYKVIGWHCKIIRR